jgi:hypothetical protein
MKKIFAVIGLSFLLATSAQAAVGSWQGSIDAAIKAGNFNQINIIAASNPIQQGAIALYLLQLAQEGNGGLDTQVKTFEAATPFVGQITPVDSSDAANVIAAMLAKASDPAFQKDHPHEAATIFTAALVMSGQPNIVGKDPNLHQEVLTAADDFSKGHPEDVDKRLSEEISLAEAGGAPNNQPLVMPRVSQ